MMSNKRELVLSKIALLASQVYARRRIHSDVLGGVSADELACHNLMLKREAAMDYQGAQDLESNQLLRLQRERRAELTEYFRDTARLKKDLIDAMLEYKAVGQRASLMEEVGSA